MKIINQSDRPLYFIPLCILGGFIGGFFGSGGGVVLVLILKKIYGNRKEIFPTVILMTLFSSAVNSVFYSHGESLSSLSPVYIISGIVGSVFGCFFFQRFKLRFLSIAFAILTVICGAIMLF